MEHMVFLCLLCIEYGHTTLLPLAVCGICMLTLDSTTLLPTTGGGCGSVMVLVVYGVGVRTATTALP